MNFKEIGTVLADYVTETELNGKGYLTSVPSQYVTDDELNAKGYLTSVPSQYVTDDELNTAISNITSKFVILEVLPSQWTSTSGLVTINLSGVTGLPTVGNYYPFAFFADYSDSLDSYFQYLPVINENISDMQPRVALTTIEGTTFTFKLENYTNLQKVYVMLTRQADVVGG
jgi:hypothetical protein